MLITFFFVLVPQVVLLLLDKNIFPIIFACAHVEYAFSLCELCWSFYAMCTIIQKNTALADLRNAQTLGHITKRKKIKTSKEIEEELYERFPNLKKNE